MGNFVWYELATADRAAKAFYADVMGLGTACSVQHLAEAYSRFDRRSRPVGYGSPAKAAAVRVCRNGLGMFEFMMCRCRSRTGGWVGL